MVRPVPALGLKAALSAGRRPRLLAALVLLRHRLFRLGITPPRDSVTFFRSMPRSSSWRTASVTVRGVRRFGFFACWLAAFTTAPAARLSGTPAPPPCTQRPTRRCGGHTGRGAAASPHGPREDQTGLRGAAAAVLLGRLLRCLLRGCHPCLRKTKNKQ
ncbi:hypothetical protein TcBrA4_0132570 [Trypanosoma cruzi]|nr:hypothetical protein TcBrA4_0132570 [Trypanosoma cruzi]